MVTSYWRGNAIQWDEAQEVWVYTEDGVVVQADPNRRCGHCGLDNRADEHDPCLGQLEGVVNACCGHGRDAEAYVQFASRVRPTLRGQDALNWFQNSTLREGERR